MENGATEPAVVSPSEAFRRVVTWTPEQRERLSASMKRAWELRRARRVVTKRVDPRKGRPLSRAHVRAVVLGMRRARRRREREALLLAREGGKREHEPVEVGVSGMNGFPEADYMRVLSEAAKMVTDRDRKGRNAVVPFYEQYVHGSQDVVFHAYRRMTRILGAERAKQYDVMYEDAVDLVNEAVFLVMMLRRERDARTSPR